MVRRAKRKTTKRKVARKKKTVRRKKPAKKASVSNKNAYWAAYHQLQKRVDQAWAELQRNVKRKASPQMIVKAKNNLMLLLGECNYMARECTRLAQKQRRRK